MDLVSGVGSGQSGSHAPTVSGAAADAAIDATNDATLNSPQTVTSPMRTSSPMTVGQSGGDSAETPSNVVYGNFGNRPANQPAPPPLPAENGSLENPQTITSPQTLTSPMTNSSPMSMASATASKGSAMSKVASAAEIAEQALDKSGQLAQGLRQALPPDGSGGGVPAQLNLHGGE